MKDNQARASIKRVDTDYNGVFRRIERLEIDQRLDRNRISAMERLADSNHDFLQMVVKDLKKVNRKCCQEMELC